jgi:hypothetical protein
MSLKINYLNYMGLKTLFCLIKTGNRDTAGEVLLEIAIYMKGSGSFEHRSER